MSVPVKVLEERREEGRIRLERLDDGRRVWWYDWDMKWYVICMVWCVGVGLLDMGETYEDG